MIARLEGACDVERALEVFKTWDAQRREFDTWAALTELRFQQDTRNPQYKADADRLNELRPKLTGLDVAIKRKFLASPLRHALEKELGAYAFERWQIEVSAYDPVVEPFVVSESRLCDEYTQLVAQAAFDFRGEHLTLAQINKFAEDPDRELRREAAAAKWAFCEKHAATLDRIYDELVHLRTEMARRLDFHNFIELGYRRLTRTGYGSAEVARYREEIAREIVPLAQRICAQQARDLGIDEIMLWDEQVFDAAPPPKPPQTYDGMMQAAKAVFSAMGPQIDALTKLMIERELLDLQARPGKASGGFCTEFPTYGLPFVFAAFNGSTHDVNVLVHEMGHALQKYLSRDVAVLDYLSPTFESCEIHSMSMEFLAWPHLERFFGADAQRYRIGHLKSSLLFLAYGAAVDHFQHFVYENPQAPAGERKAFWKQLEATYLPWRRYGGIGHLERGGYWQMQRHVYLVPFYYIDYTLAMCCALQFWARSLDDYEGAMADYRALCARGGRLPFVALVRSAGLRSPFEPGVLHDVAQRAASML